MMVPHIYDKGAAAVSGYARTGTTELMLWIVVALVLVIVVGLILGTSPTMRARREGSGPGGAWSSDPTGRIAPRDTSFERPHDEGRLL